jgi:hypothetical protein
VEYDVPNGRLLEWWALDWSFRLAILTVACSVTVLAWGLAAGLFLL